MVCLRNICINTLHKGDNGGGDDDDDDDDDNNNNNNNNNNNKQNKYQELANEICAMWKQNTAQVIPIVVSSTGLIPKSLSQSLKRLGFCNSSHMFKCKKLSKL